MKHMFILISALGLGIASPILAQTAAAPATPTDAEMFQKAAVSLDQAGVIALGAVSGTLSGISFDLENGQSVYSATIIDANGAEHIVQVDANSGAILVQGLTSMIGEEIGAQGDYADNDGGADDESDESGNENDDGGHNDTGENGESN